VHFSELDLIWRLALALGFSSVIGLEREIRQKSAGLRTNALVGTGAGLFMLASQYGFADVLGRHVMLDPSRVAAQVVSGIGFIGGGLIFVRRTDVRGLTTAASVWVSAAVGMAAGGDLPILGAVTTVGYLIVSFGYAALEQYLPRSRDARSSLKLTYLDGQGLLRQLLRICGEHGFSISDVELERAGEGSAGIGGGERTVTLQLQLRGRGSLSELTEDLDAVHGVLGVGAVERNGSSGSS
jgi:putative Mg2+ transporter-C (MgtC) family protein